MKAVRSAKPSAFAKLSALAKSSAFALVAALTVLPAGTVRAADIYLVCRSPTLPKYDFENRPNYQFDVNVEKHSVIENFQSDRTTLSTEDLRPRDNPSGSSVFEFNFRRPPPTTAEDTPPPRAIKPPIVEIWYINRISGYAVLFRPTTNELLGYYCSKVDSLLRPKNLF